MARVYEFLADGFEEVEALTPVDVLRRGGVDVQTVSVTGNIVVRSSHGVAICADALIEDIDIDSAEMLLLPGGMPGSQALDSHEGVRAALVAFARAGKRIGAICAAPMVLGHLGLLRGRRATCYPGFENHLEGATSTGELFTVDGNIITGRGPAASLPYACKVLSLLQGDTAAHEVAEGMGVYWK